VIEDLLVAATLAPVLVTAHDVGVSAKPDRRRFSVAYKLKVIAEAAHCTQPGEIAALLRREGLYTSHLAAWRAAERRGELAGPAAPAPRRGPAPTPPDPNAKRIAELERQLAKATARAERAEALVEVQKKVAALLDQLRTASEATSASGDAPNGPR